MQKLVIFLLFSLSYCYNYEDFTRINHEQPLNEYTQSSSLNVIVFVDKQQCNSESDDTCRQQRSQLEQIRHLCTSANIQFAISTNITIAEKYFNIYGSLPKLCFLRNGFPVVYSGSLSNMDSLQEWLSEARERLTHVLDDKSFEHDTQASTGSTTGDWFILFKKTNDSRSLLPIWEAAALQFRNRAIFAYVNVDTNPIIQKRFHLFYLPIFILFKQGKMYRYESASWKQISFIEFIENDYKKVKAENVPAELSAFDTLQYNNTIYFTGTTSLTINNIYAEYHRSCAVSCSCITELVLINELYQRMTYERQIETVDYKLCILFLIL